jgi:hypothetical protein
MADEVLGQLNTSEVANGFNDFLESQGLGDMNPSSAVRFKDGVIVSPMDEILELNGFDIDSLFRKKLPEPPPLASLGSDNAETVTSTRSDEGIQNVKSAVRSLGLSSDELATLGNLLSSGGNLSVGTLPAPMLELLYSNPGVKNAEDLLLQLGELYGLLKVLQSPSGKNLTEIMLLMMAELETDDSRVLLSYLRRNPHVGEDALRDPIIGTRVPLAWTTSLLKSQSAFDFDPIIGTISSETLASNRAGSSSLTGGGGADLFVIALRSDPFASATVITDFSEISGSKLVLDTIDYEGHFKPTFKAANSQKKLAKLIRSNTTLIFSSKTGELLLNANRRAKGFGENGGTIASLENRAALNGEDILVFDGSSLFRIDGTNYSA